MNYNDFLKTKNKRLINYGFDININQINNKLFNYQKDIAKRDIKKGR